MKTKNVLIILVVSVLFVFALIAYFTDHINIGITHY